MSRRNLNISPTTSQTSKYVLPVAPAAVLSIKYIGFSDCYYHSVFKHTRASYISTVTSRSSDEFFSYLPRPLIFRSVELLAILNVLIAHYGMFKIFDPKFIRPRPFSRSDANVGYLVLNVFQFVKTRYFPQDTVHRVD